MIKLLIFDAGDLLWTTSNKSYERAMKKFFKKHKINGKVIESRWNKIKDEVEVGKIKYRKAVDIQFKGLNFNRKVPKEWFELHVNTDLISKKLLPRVKPTLEKLKKQYKLVILTDECKGKRYRIKICKKLGIDFFEEIFSSHDIGYKKPHKNAFFIVLNRFKVKPSEAVFIGHSKDELEGARKHKIKTIAYKWDKGTKADFYIKKFSDIPKVLEKIQK